jgi:hypothetical protein
LFIYKTVLYLHPQLRAISSVGSEHLVYTEGVGGSNPSLPTKFHFDKEFKNNIRAISSVGSEHLVYTEGVGGSNPSLPTSITILMNFHQDFLFSKNRSLLRDFLKTKKASSLKVVFFVVIDFKPYVSFCIFVVN